MTYLVLIISYRGTQIKFMYHSTFMVAHSDMRDGR